MFSLLSSDAQDYLVKGGLIFLLIIAALSKYIYRLTWHPLAKFPGPKLAGASNLYGAFFDLTGNPSYIKTFPALHDKYGPIVRAWPNELHIQDLESHSQIFKPGSKFDKWNPFYENPPLTGTFVSAPREEAVARRAMLSPSFTRESIRRAEPRIAKHVNHFLEKLGDYTRTSEPADLSKGFLCLTNDVVMEQIFQKPFGALEAERFDSEFTVPVHDFVQVMQWPTYFPNLFKVIFKLMDLLPDWVYERWLQGFVTQKKYLEMSHDRIAYLQSGIPGQDRPTSVFDTTLHPNIEKGQFTPPIKDLAADAFTFVMAGTDTTASVLITAVFSLLNGPNHMLERLKGELREVIPDREAMADWYTLEKLNYLRAVSKESLRLSYGVPGRIPRVVPKGGAVFFGQHVPAGTIVSSGIYMHNMNPTVFPSPHEFRPERWLDGDPRLDQYMCSFSRGTRACLGMNGLEADMNSLAYCELYLTLAHLLRRYELQLFETTKEDMDWKDTFVILRRGHLRVLVKEVEN